MSALKFFQNSEGWWRSHRITHHLLLRRSESGNTEIEVKLLAGTDPQVLAICQLHQIQPHRAEGGCSVSWQGSMAWDREEEQHQGSTVFVLVPHPQDPHSGQLLRERGYAENVPIIGHYQVDSQGGLVLTTEYETVRSVERFWFPNPNLRLRTSTVQRLGGFTTTSFCVESRICSSDSPAKTILEASLEQATSTNPDLRASGWGW
ncbi:MAG: phycobiliprotein lyase [Acaryochloridaceae cyanobacterium SU_2_1]|nr:phycobiliprotein lyase [Acaryochloridaceae cyanobacterium SU_2_1]